MKARLSGIATSIPVLPVLRVLPALVALALVAAACGASSPPARQTALLSIIPPAMTTTVHADTIDGEHVVFTPVDLNADAARRVYVHLTESNTTPTPADPMWGAMANAGARVIVLAHDTLDGQALEDDVRAIPEVLATLLGHLDDSAPADGWDAFLGNAPESAPEDAVAWDRVIIAGHRDGADRAALLGSEFPTDRVVLFAGPLNVDLAAGSGATTGSKILTFASTSDDLAALEQRWDALDVPTEATRFSSGADGQASSVDFEGNRFLSELTPIDGFNPRNDWQHRRYQALWEYVCCE